MKHNQENLTKALNRAAMIEHSRKHFAARPELRKLIRIHTLDAQPLRQHYLLRRNP